MGYEISQIRPGEAAELKRLACPNFSVVERLFMSKPKLGLVARADDGSYAGGAFLVVTEAGGRRVGCIDIIFVLPEHRGSGAARLLNHAAVEELHNRGCTTVMALVRGDNSQSLRRFEAEGVLPVSLRQLRRRISTAAIAELFIKTASLACATGCWILCEGAVSHIGDSGQNLLRVAAVNGFMLLCGALFGAAFKTSSYPWWNMLAALLLLCVLTLGETLGRAFAGGRWHYVMPEGGLVPAAVVALLGGFYPMAGHWYLTERENSVLYRRRMAAPASVSWLLLLAATGLSSVLYNTNSLFPAVSELGSMLLLLYALPFYPFDSFAARRVREYSAVCYGVLAVLSLVTLATVTWWIA